MAKGRKGILGPQKVIAKKKAAAQPSSTKASAPSTSERRIKATSGPATKFGGGTQNDAARLNKQSQRQSSSTPQRDASPAKRPGQLGPQRVVGKGKSSAAGKPPGSKAQSPPVGRGALGPQKTIAKKKPAGHVASGKSAAASAHKNRPPRKHTPASGAAAQAGDAAASKGGKPGGRKRGTKQPHRAKSAAPQANGVSNGNRPGDGPASRKRADLQDLLTELKVPAEIDPTAAAADLVGTAAPGASNWELLKGRIARSDAAKAPAGAAAVAAARFRDARQHRKAAKRAAAAVAAAAAAAADGATLEGIVDGKLVPKGPDTSHTRVLSMDCEMVGVGVTSVRSALARVCIVNDFGNVLLDLYVKPKEKVTDYRTQYSGIRPRDLADGASLEEAMQRVHDLLKGHVLVGHALHNDFKVLMLEGVVPAKDLRDTAVYEPLMTATASGRKLRSRALRVLAREELGLEIQAGEHSPVEDARAVLYIYHKHKALWEAKIKAGLIKPRSLKSSGKIATGAKRMKGPRATDAHVQRTAAAASAPGGEDVEYAAPSLEGIARMQAHMTGAALDIYADR